ncbi:MAG TPA: Fe-Mn family superoxide dismutase [Elusimicrobiota bacterium]|nr:Fe-Mn family superoxide dismutase [Elusimicrobiota bacterium]
MPYTAMNFDRLLGTPGFSDQLLKNHFTLYQGYVTNTNKLSDALGALSKEGKQAAPESAEQKRRFGWEFNGMRLHELYFGNMTKTPGATAKDSALHKKIGEEFGSFEAWEKDFKGTGAMRGIGWAMLYYDPLGQRLFNTWVNEHDAGHLSGTAPLLILDVFEHAFMIDYGLKRADYIEAFSKAIDWAAVAHRFETCAKIKALA